MNWQPINLADEQYAEPSEPPNICGLLYQGLRHTISGLPEALKTAIALIFALEHMRAGGGKVCLLDFEMGAKAIRRLLTDLGATLEEIASFHYINPTGPPDKDDIAALEFEGVTLTILDAAAGAYDASDLDDNKRADAEQFAKFWIAPLWRRGITSVVIDHVVKNTDARGRFAIGSERKLGAVDVHLGFEAIRPLSRGGTGLIRVTVHKDRPGHLTRPAAVEIELHSDPDTHRITWEIKQASAGGDDDFRPTVLIDRVLDYLDRNPEPISRSALANVVQGNREWLLRGVEILLAEGRLELQNKKIVRSDSAPDSAEERSWTSGTTFEHPEALDEAKKNVPGTFPELSFLSPQGEERLPGTTFAERELVPEPEPGPRGSDAAPPPNAARERP